MQIRKTPKTDAVYLKLKQQIASGVYPNGMLPVEPDLAVQLQVSRKTLRSALSRLALENRISRVKGEGTFIHSPEERKDKILVMLRNVEDITFPERYILPGIQQEAAAMNLLVETCAIISLTADSVENAVRSIQRKNYCGILLLDAHFRGDEPIVDILKQTGLPVLLPHAAPGDAERPPFAVMGTDYRQVIRDGMQYLVNLGHRRIAYVAYRELRIDKESYFRLREELGLDPNPELYAAMTSHNQHDVIMTGMEKFFGGLREMPTAVLCFSDYFALCLYEYLKKHQLRIPEDIAVLSIGGMIGCDFLSPPLSSLDFDCMAIGRIAVRTLMEMKMKKQLTRPFAATPHRLTERESTRKPELESNCAS